MGKTLIKITKTDILEANLRHPEILEQHSITVKGGVPWDNNQNNQ